MRNDDSDKIPLKVFTVVNGIMLVFALLVAAARMVIRFYSQRKLHPDDFVLFFACSTFVASQTLLYVIKIADLYWLGALVYHSTDPQNLAFILEGPEAFYRRLVRVRRMGSISSALTWTSIFAVKICFLLFFYQLVTRLRRLILAWRVIFGVTIIFWAFCVSSIFISCPRYGPTSTKCLQGRGLIQGLSVSIISVVLDIISDLLLISIPLILLWKVKIQRQQKIFVGIFLCLNVCMIIIAIVRTSGFVKKKSFDIVWISFWLHLEGAVAIIMVSLTAFRSMPGIKSLKAREKERVERSWLLHRPKLLVRYFKKETKDESKSQQLPSVPGATFTGMRTFINGNGIRDESKAVGMTHKSEKDWPRAASHEPQEFDLAHLSTVLDGTESARASNFV